MWSRPVMKSQSSPLVVGLSTQARRMSWWSLFRSSWCRKAGLQRFLHVSKFHVMGCSFICIGHFCLSCNPESFITALTKTGWTAEWEALKGRLSYSVLNKLDSPRNLGWNIFRPNAKGLASWTLDLSAVISEQSYSPWRCHDSVWKC